MSARGRRTTKRLHDPRPSTAFRHCPSPNHLSGSQRADAVGHGTSAPIPASVRRLRSRRVQRQICLRNVPSLPESFRNSSEQCGSCRTRSPFAERHFGRVRDPRIIGAMSKLPLHSQFFSESQRDKGVTREDRGRRYARMEWAYTSTPVGNCVPGRTP